MIILLLSTQAQEFVFTGNVSFLVMKCNVNIHDHTVNVIFFLILLFRCLHNYINMVDLWPICKDTALLLVSKLYKLKSAPVSSYHIFLFMKNQIFWSWTSWTCFLVHGCFVVFTHLFYFLILKIHPSQHISVLCLCFYDCV